MKSWGPARPSSDAGTHASSGGRRLQRLLEGGGRTPLSSWIALAGVAISLLLTLWAAAGTDPAIVVGGVLAFAVPYLTSAIALRGRTVWSQALGVVVAALMAWLTSSGLVEVIGSIAAGNPPRTAALTFVLLTVVSLSIFCFGLRDLIRIAHDTGYWARTPLPARLALLALAFWSLTFVADSYVSGGLPLIRMLMAPLLMVAFLAVALMLRASDRRPQVTGILLVVGAGLATARYWVAYSPYLTMAGGPSTVPYVGYHTLLPWPVLLSLSLAIDVAVVVAGTRRFLRST